MLGASDRARRDLARTAIQLLVLAVLIAASYSIVRPFIMATAWATAIAVATWPILLRTQAWLGGRRGLAVAVMTVAILLVVLLPFYFGVTALVGGAGQMVDASASLATLVPQPPAWVHGLPVMGPRVAARWQAVAAATPEEISAHLAPFAREVVLWFVGQVGGLGLLLVQVVLTIVIVAILYTNGEAAVCGADRLARRLAGAEGAKVLHLAARAARAVALGVIVTAIVQTALVVIGLAVVGAPFVSILGALVFILAVAQVGPLPVLLPAVIWVYQTRSAGWSAAFLVWSIVCGALDNVLRPMLIKRGADLPLLLVFTGVIGGLVAFGIIGLFVGPVVLAVAYTLLGDWVSEGEADEERSAAPPASG